MIVYLATKTQFRADVFSNQIEDKILALVKGRLGHSVGPAEVQSWKNSMAYMDRILDHDEIPSDAGVAIEFAIPQTSKRVDFIITGIDDSKRRTAVIIELKQWTEAKHTGKDAVVSTFVGRREQELPHPSYQAWSYAALLEDFNEAVREVPIRLMPCAYLHNCISDSVINGEFYGEHTARAPAFLKRDAAKLREFIKQHVRFGDSGETMYAISNGKIRPSKNLADKLLSLLQGNKEFLMIDDQKLVYETALDLARKSSKGRKHVLIVDGGPGTGKSVVAINLLVELTGREQVTKYVTKNAAPRDVYESKLTGSFSRTRINNLFTGSGAFTETERNTFDSLIVDEAHRLNSKSGMFQNLGENQIKEIVNSAKFSVFFLDEDQRVTFKDIGEKTEIRRWAKALGAEVQELALQSQFRCNGSDGYLAWTDNVLQIRETANRTLESVNYEFAVCDSAAQLRDIIFNRNKINNRARMVAGYCWDWASKTDPKVNDIVLDDGKFEAKWNLEDDGNLWILKPDSVSEVGCIHTCQGLELDYIGVIIGPDLVVRGGVAQTHADKRSRMDSSIRGFKQMLAKDAASARNKADQIIKNTYRTLMTRAQKGCFVYSVDPETNQYLKDAAKRTAPVEISDSIELRSGLPFRILEEHEVKPFENAVPIFDFKVAAGHFSSEQWTDGCCWAELPEPFQAKRDFFVAQVIGESMNRKIPNRSWCLFRKPRGGSRQGKVVLVQHRSIHDADSGGQYTVKVYESIKTTATDSWEHQQIVLKPDSNQTDFAPIILKPDEARELQVIGEYVAVLG